jgi:hypothetical protein
MIVTAKTRRILKIRRAMAKTKVPQTYWNLHRRWDEERGLGHKNLNLKDAGAGKNSEL